MKTENLNETINVIKAYISLTTLNDGYRRKRLEELTQDVAELSNVLAEASKLENRSDVYLILKMLNTKSIDSIDETRKVLFATIATRAGINTNQFKSVLIESSGYSELGDKVLDYYLKYRPNFKCEMEGMFDESNEVTPYFEKVVSNADSEIKKLMAELHTILWKKDKSSEEKTDAKNLIDELRKYVVDTVPDRVRYIEAKPGKIAEIKEIENTPTCFSYYNGNDYVEDRLTETMFVAWDTNAKANNLLKNRVLYGEMEDDAAKDGEQRPLRKLGVARGTIIFYTKDEFGNYVNLNDEQIQYLNTFYRQPGFEKEETSARTENISEEAQRAIELVNNTLYYYAGDPMGVNTLRKLGFTDEEIGRGKRMIAKKKK